MLNFYFAYEKNLCVNGKLLYFFCKIFQLYVKKKLFKLFYVYVKEKG